MSPGSQPWYKPSHRTIRVSGTLVGALVGALGDRVDVMLYLRKNAIGESGDNRWRKLLQNVKVFSVVDPADAEADQAVQVRIVSLVVTPEQFQKLALARKLGRVLLMPRVCSEGVEWEVVETAGE